MRQSILPSFVRKDFPKDEEAYNAQILIRAGFIDKTMAGVYSYLPLGLRVLRRIEDIVRSRMNEFGAQEIMMPVLHPKELWQKTGRWDALDVLFKVIARDKKEYALGPTHEEVVSPLAHKAIFSYKDLPFALYQIQTKLRDEPRAKSGLLRGREFLMKDLYSFHADEKDLEAYYQKAIEVYRKIFSDIGLSAVLVEASGGTFSKYSHEFQVFIDAGEDTIVYCPQCSFAQNNEINSAQEKDACPSCKGPLTLKKGAEVGNIFPLKQKYSEPFEVSYKNAQGESQTVMMGCYGIGISRLMGVAAEIFHDDKGLRWPAAIAPFHAHLIVLTGNNKDEAAKVVEKADRLYDHLTKEGIDVLYDDRLEMSAGEKFVEADLVGIPVRLVISAKTGDAVEMKYRADDQATLVDFDAVAGYCKNVQSKQ